MNIKINILFKIKNMIEILNLILENKVVKTYYKKLRTFNSKKEKNKNIMKEKTWKKKI